MDQQASTLVERYKSLADIERGFRTLKSELEIAPVHHRLPQRIRAHTLICFMALVIQRLMRQRLKQAEHESSPLRALERLRSIQRHRIQLPSGQVLHGISTITAKQAGLFQSLEAPKPTMQRLEEAM